MIERPTEIEFATNLSRTISASSLFIKRDDCNNLAFGGNKVRQVEYYFGDAIAKGCDTVLITGATQSNFVRTTAAMAAKAGFQCHVQLESRVANQSVHYQSSGNVLLNRLFGATIHYYCEGEDEFGADAKLRQIAQQLTTGGRKPYVIPLAPGHPPLGALGYVRAATELKQQLEHESLRIDEIYVGSGSGNTHAGLLFGLRALGLSIKVVGVCVRREKSLQHERISNRCQEIAELLEVESPIESRDIVVVDDFFPPGYGVASADVWDSMILTARAEGLVLDPTYTGKVMAACLDRCKRADASANILFVHTGGTPAIFGYHDQLQQAMAV